MTKSRIIEAPNDSEANRALNRRVEVLILRGKAPRDE